MIQNYQRVNKNQKPVKIQRLENNFAFIAMHYVKVYDLSKIEAKSYKVVNEIDDEKIVKFLNNLHPFIGFL